MHRFSKQLVVLVGGKGTRLGQAAHNTPKPLMPIDGDRVFLDYLLENCVRQGFDDIVLLAGHLGAQVRDRYHNRRFGNAMISVLVEPEPMGTGGAFRFALDRLAPTFVAANGDTLFDVNLRAVDAALQTSPHWQGVLALREIADAGRFGSVAVGADGDIVAFREKDPKSAGASGLINGGIYALRREAIESLMSGPASIEADLFPALAAGGKLGGMRSDGYFLDIGLPETLEQARATLPARRRPVLFLDRDGVINIDKTHLYRIEDFEWVQGVKALIRRRNDLGHAVIVVTNQAGVAKGKYDESDIWKLHDHIQQELYAEGAFIDAFYYCPYHAEAVTERYRITNHPDRKPSPGMLEKAFCEHKLDRTQAVLIGDNDSDMAAAAAAGIRGFLFKDGNVSDFEMNALKSGTEGRPHGG